MAKLDLQKYGEDLKNAISLVAEFEQECDEEFRRKDVAGKGYIEYELNSINIEDLTAKGKEKELMDFLTEKDYELTKILCIFLWVGRDSSLQESDGTYDYDKIRDSIDKSGWEPDKLGKIDYLLGKQKLFTHIQNGLLKLDIRL